MEPVPPARVQTPAQKSAFEKCRAARAAALERKRAEKAATQAMESEPQSPNVAEPPEPDPEPEPAQEPAPPATSAPVPAPVPPVQAPPAPAADDDEHEYLDVSELVELVRAQRDVLDG